MRYSGALLVFVAGITPFPSMAGQAAQQGSPLQGAVKVGSHHARPVSGAGAHGISSRIVRIVDRATHGLAIIQKVAAGPAGYRLVLVHGKSGSPASGRKAVFWYDPRGGTLFIGSAFGPNGASLQGVADHALGIPAPATGNTASLKAEPAGSPGARAIRSLQSARGYHSFTEGHGPDHITALVDPNCIFCHLWWSSLTAAPGWKARYTVTWVPLGFLKPSSAAKSATLLKGGSRAIDQDESEFNVSSEEGGAALSHNRALLADVAQNDRRWQRQMRLLGLQTATPTLIARGIVHVGDVPPASLFPVSAPHSPKHQ